jgi:hypothetical protein
MPPNLRASAAVDRRALTMAGAALLAMAGRVSAQTVAPAAAERIDIYDAYPKTWASRDGGAWSWWLSGVMFAHVDGLREFTVLEERSLMIVRAERQAGGMSFARRQIGYYQDPFTGKVATGWDNPFLGRTQPLQPRFSEGPRRYLLTPRPPAGASLTLDDARARTIAMGVTAHAQEGHIALTQSETTVQGFPDAQGRPPPLGAPGATGLQTVLSLLAPQPAVLDPAVSAAPASGFYTRVWDSLPGWMGFGERYGSALSKGLMRKMRLGEAPDPDALRRLQALFPDAFRGDLPRTDWG